MILKIREDHQGHGFPADTHWCSHRCRWSCNWTCWKNCKRIPPFQQSSQGRLSSNMRILSKNSPQQATYSIQAPSVGRHPYSHSPHQGRCIKSYIWQSCFKLSPSSVCCLFSKIFTFHDRAARVNGIIVNQSSRLNGAVSRSEKGRINRYEDKEEWAGNQPIALTGWENSNLEYAVMLGPGSIRSEQFWHTESHKGHGLGILNVIGVLKQDQWQKRLIQQWIR